MVWDAAHTIQFTRRSNTKLVFYVTAVVVVLAVVSSLTWILPRLVGVGAGQAAPHHQIVIDTDPGIDDALAILTTLGDPSVNVLAITCVRGNTDAPNVVVNALKILTIAGKLQIPVYTGYNFGLLNSPDTNDWFGSDGLGDLPFPSPPSSFSAQPEHAASFLARIVKENPGTITVLAIGPLTNLALALHLNPRFLQEARRVIILGGSIRGYGNVSPGVEFNFHMDPDAAALVLKRASESRSLITLVPMETCNDNELTKEWRWKELAEIDNPVVSFLNKLEQKQLLMHPSPTYVPFDTYAAAVTLYLDFVSHSQELYGFVENGGQSSRGALMVDYLNTTQNAANLEVIMEVNTTMLKQKLIENFSNFK